MGCEGMRDPQGYPAKVDSSGSLQTTTTVNGTVDVTGSSVDVGSVSSPVQTTPPVWTNTGRHNADSSVGTSGVLVSDDTPGRVYIRITNIGPNTVFIFPGGTGDVSVTDTMLPAGASMEFHGGYEGQWSAIAATGSNTVCVIEFKV